MTMYRWPSETVHDQAGNWLWTRISVTPLFLPSVLLGVPVHLGDPVGAVQGLLLLVGHGGARDVQVVMAGHKGQ